MQNSQSPFQCLLEAAKTAKEAGNLALGRNLLIHCLDLSLNFLELSAVNAEIKAFPLSVNQELRLAVLATSTVEPLLEALRLNLEIRNFKVEIYNSPYDSIEQEVLNSESGLYRFSPTHVLLLMDAEDLDFVHSLEQLRGNPALFQENQWPKFAMIWNCLKKIPSCQVIQSTIAIPPERYAGQLENRAAWGNVRLIDELNRSIRANSDHLAVLDMDFLSAVYGKNNWFDRFFWFHSKQAFAPSAIALVSKEITRILLAMAGAGKKCLVLDLDNTLWGGVIGDDGVDGLELGMSSVAGEAFVEFQKYLKRLKDRGVILAVCSKNQENTARIPFQNHSAMALTEEDISCFVANFENKADNIRRIAKSLNIGLDSLVFFDDNPAERKLVRDLIPEVYTVEVPENPSLFVRALDELGLFEIDQLSPEDLQRTAQYRANADREQLKEGATDLTDYLKSLDMTCYTEKAVAEKSERLLQLINK